ncbi:guanine deaminase [Modestobacter sp. KNN46-3]|jgi:guanine deaminase|uniref:guanine deaminase n=1 Tax=Modestobacter sp. KNN46-3 TaxID=2711218 RepID=UPI0013DF6B66|nr:guanine deaminase [Modestobacter sp. KNN46-3]
MTLFRGTVLDTPDDPFAGGVLRAEADAGLLVRAGAIVDRGSFAEVRARHAAEDVVDLTGGLLLPGFVDTHVHFPQVRVIGGLGMPLLDWLDRCALPEEARLRDVHYARAVASEFVSGLAQAGTTTALVFGSHFPSAVDALFAEAARVGLRVTSGLVVSDRLLREELLTSPQRAYDEGLALARRWHGVGRNRYAVTPRFSLSCGEALLESSGSLLREVAGGWFTSHVNENEIEIATVADLFDGSSYLDTYCRYDLVGRRSVLAHNVHPTDEELKTLCAADASVAHCPTSNAALGSGLFPLKRHRGAGVRVALGSDVGAGTGFSLLKEGLQAYFLQQLLGGDGLHLTSTHLLHLATAAGADALDLGDDVGDLSVGKRFDAVWLRPRPGTTLDVALRNAGGHEDALAKAFALGSPADIDTVWIDGQPLQAQLGQDDAASAAPSLRQWRRLGARQR